MKIFQNVISLDLLPTQQTHWNKIDLMFGQRHSFNYNYQLKKHFFWDEVITSNCSNAAWKYHFA